jgi:hypothetical protein
MLLSALCEILGMGKRKTQGCDWLAKRGDVLGKHPKAGLRVSFQKSSGIRATNWHCVFLGQQTGSSPSVIIREIRGCKNSSFRTE